MSSFNNDFGRVLIWCALLLGFAGGIVDAMPEEKVLVVGITWADESALEEERASEIQRFESELALAIAHTLGYRVHFRLAPLDVLLRELAEGKIDFMPGIARMPDRLRQLDFSVPHSRMTTNIFVRHGDRRDFSPEALRGKKIVVIKGSYSYAWALQRGYGPSVIEVADLTEGVRRLAAEESDCLLAKQVNIYTAMRAAGASGIEARGPPIPGLVQDLCCAVKLGNRDLLAHINEALFTLKQSGALDRIYERWLDVMVEPSILANRVTRWLALAVAALGLLAGGIWVFGRMQARRAQAQLAEIERQVKERTDELAAAKARFESVVAATPAGIVLFDPHDRAVPGRIVDCNEMTCRMHGYTKAELIGGPFQQLLGRPLSPGELGKIAGPVKGGGSHEGHARHRRKDGSVLEVEFHSTGITLDGRDLVLAVDLDVTDRLHAEEALRRTEEFQRLVLEAINDGIFEWARADDAFSLSQHGWKMLGGGENEFAGWRAGWWRRMHPDDVAAAEAALARTLEGGAAFVHTARFLHKDGSVRWLYCRALPVLDAAGRTERLVGSYTDITALKRIDEELQITRRLRAVGELTGGIAHEFNNLLTPILLQASLLAGESELPPAMASQLAPIREAARRAQALTQRLLQFGRRTEGGLEPVALAQVVESTLALLRSTLDRRIELQSESDPGLGPLLLDSAGMGQAVMNLILNARDALLQKLAAAPCPGWRARIAVTVSRVSGRARTPGAAARSWQRLSVRDNGAGMSAEVRERIFEPFFTTKSAGHGTGLGLAVVWRVMEERGGWIDVQSTPGEGAEFSLWLPDDSAEPAVVRAPAEVRAGAAGGRRLLFVEDDELVGAAVGRMLRVFGHEVEWERDSEAALRRLRENGGRWDALVTDLNMPGLSGDELVERARGAGFAGKIVVMSGHIAAPVETRLRAAAVDAIVQKPFEVEQIRAVFAELWAE